MEQALLETGMVGHLHLELDIASVLVNVENSKLDILLTSELGISERVLNRKLPNGRKTRNLEHGV